MIHTHCTMLNVLPVIYCNPMFIPSFLHVHAVLIFEVQEMLVLGKYMYVDHLLTERSVKSRYPTPDLKENHHIPKFIWKGSLAFSWQNLWLGCDGGDLVAARSP